MTPPHGVTADTITDAQVRELRDTAREAIEGRLKRDETWTYDRRVKWISVEYHARVALGERRARRGGSRAMARARCAEILNARSAK